MLGGGNFNPRQMARMMKQLGIDVTEIEDVEEVHIRTRTKDIVIQDPAVTIMDAQGQRTWQVTGEADEQPREGAEAASEPAELELSDEDIALVMTQAGVSKQQARDALRDNDGEPAAAIMALTEDEDE